MTDRKAITSNHLFVVLGMHRSGTSAITNGLRVLGAGFGSNLQPAMAGVNEKGFFEDNDIVSINEQLLVELSIEWHTLTPITEEQLASPAFEPVMERAVELVKEKARSEGILAIKDPRMARLLPFWKNVFEAAGVDVSYIIAVRNPLSVAKSLEKRDNIAKEKSYVLWLQHLIPSIKYTADDKRVIVDYDRVIANPRAELVRISQQLGQKTEIDPIELQKYENDFLDPKLRHTSFDLADLLQDSSAPAGLIRVYNMLLKAAADEISISCSESSEILRATEKELDAFAPMLRYATRQDWKLAELRQELHARNNQDAATSEELKLLKDNISALEVELKLLKDNISALEIEHRHAANDALENIAALELREANLRSEAEGLRERIKSLREYSRELASSISAHKEYAEQQEVQAKQQRDHAEQTLAYANELREMVSQIHGSTSWRITAPLRKISRLKSRASRLYGIYKNYRKKHTGIVGLLRIAGRSIEALQKGGLTALRKSVTQHVLTESLAPTRPTILPPLVINDTSPLDATLPEDVAVHTHIYYVDLAPEICSYLANIPCKFHLYITTDTQEKAAALEHSFKSIANIKQQDIRVVVNRGRDVAPMIVALGKELSRHDVVLHIHTKRSPHNPELRGWRRYLMNTLLGSRESVSAVLNRFATDRTLGILYPQIYLPVIPFMRIGGNASFIEALLGRAGHSGVSLGHLDQTNFPAGGMFWFRGQAIEPLVRLELKLDDFCEESGQDDATIAHAIERLFPYFSQSNGLHAQPFIPEKLSSARSGAAPLSLIRDYSCNNILGDTIILFDHNIGGGTNRYSRNLIDQVTQQSKSVLRVYYAHESWVIEWISADDGLIFADYDAAQVFEALSHSGSHEIIVNSIYGYPDVDRVVQRILDLTEALHAALDVKVHDFYAICPSQHLLDQHENYCGVPRDFNVCTTCLKSNQAAHWASTQPIHINAWRDPFSKLLARSTSISVFDRSSADILNKAFELDEEAIKVTPHTDDYFVPDENIRPATKSLNMGILGTLTTIKGASVINRLAEYIEKTAKEAEITIVGASVTPVHHDVKILGPYENRHLSKIISDNGINLFLMPTIVPETFSYTISEAMKMKLPIVAFDLGAQGSRVREYELGEVIPLDSSAEEIFNAAAALLGRVQELRK